MGFSSNIPQEVLCLTVIPLLNLTKKNCMKYLSLFLEVFNDVLSFLLHRQASNIGEDGTTALLI